jgi:hypothetical protein
MGHIYPTNEGYKKDGKEDCYKIKETVNLLKLSFLRSCFTQMICKKVFLRRLNLGWELFDVKELLVILLGEVMAELLCWKSQVLGSHRCTFINE